MDQDKTSYLNRSGYGAGAGGAYRSAHVTPIAGNAAYRGAHSASVADDASYRSDQGAPADATRRVEYPTAAMGEAPAGYATGACVGADAACRVDQSGLPQDPIYAPQETAYMPRAAALQQPYSQQPYAQRAYPQQQGYGTQPAGRQDYPQRAYSQGAYPEQETYPAQDAYPQQSPYQRGARDAFSRPEPARATAAPAERYRGSALAKTMIGILVALFVVSFGYSLINGLLGNGAAILGNAVSGLTQNGQSSSTADVSTDDIVGQYWSNAKTILKSRGANVSDMVVLTDDGSKPVLDSNWVVSQIYTNSDGKLEVQLTRATGAGDAVGGIVDELGQKATDVWSSLQGAMGGVSSAG